MSAARSDRCHPLHAARSDAGTLHRQSFRCHENDDRRPNWPRSRPLSFEGDDREVAVAIDRPRAGGIRVDLESPEAGDITGLGQGDDLGELVAESGVGLGREIRRLGQLAGLGRGEDRRALAGRLALCGRLGGRRRGLRLWGGRFLLTPAFFAWAGFVAAAGAFTASARLGRGLPVEGAIFRGVDFDRGDDLVAWAGDVVRERATRGERRLVLRVQDGVRISPLRRAEAGVDSAVRNRWLCRISSSLFSQKSRGGNARRREQHYRPPKSQGSNRVAPFDLSSAFAAKTLP